LLTATPPQIDHVPTPAAPATIGKRQRPERWSFFGESSLPEDPAAREHERRGRKWLFVSYFLCPCHVPITLALAGVLFGGTAFGAVITGNALRVGIVLTSGYVFVLWRGFRQIRRAKRIEAAGGTISCAPGGCTVTRSNEEA